MHSLSFFLITSSGVTNHFLLSKRSRKSSLAPAPPWRALQPGEEGPSQEGGLAPAASCSHPAEVENLAAAGFSGHPPPGRAGCEDRFALVPRARLAELSSLLRALAAQAVLALPGLLPSPASLGKPWRPGNAVRGAGGLEQLGRIVIPAPPGQGSGDVKGGGFGAVTLAGGSVHPKGSIFWRQTPGYQSICREGVGSHLSWAITAFGHRSPLPSTLGKPASARGVQTTQVSISEQVSLRQVCQTHEGS